MADGNPNTNADTSAGPDDVAKADAVTGANEFAVIGGNDDANFVCDCDSVLGVDPSHDSTTSESPSVDTFP
eukprot:10727074-Ditylum_brightwellii.AAC.1